MSAPTPGHTQRAYCDCAKAETTWTVVQRGIDYSSRVAYWWKCLNCSKERYISEERPPVPPQSSSRCFVATVAYRSSCHASLEPLRWFRDQLGSFAIGSVLVAIYYYVGPGIARGVKAIPLAPELLRLSVFDPLVLAIRWYRSRQSR